MPSRPFPASPATVSVGSNRDEFVVVRKMKNVDWLDGEQDGYQQTLSGQEKA
ncbi:TPA: hypothetical protein ACJI8U_002147 [Morganella morganii]